MAKLLYSLELVYFSGLVSVMSCS